MKLSSDLEIISPHRAIYIESIDTTVISDLHLGFEGIAAQQGIFIPKVQYGKVVEELREVMKKRKSSTVIVNGDVKHEFSETSYTEFVEVGRFYDFLRESYERVIQIKGNHDNYIIYVTKKHSIELYDSLAFGDYFFVHGHKPIELEEVRPRNVIVSHEHPAVALFDDVGGKDKVSCFLYGEVEDKEVTVLPAFSYFAEGSEVNVIPQEEFLSPLLRDAALSKLRVIAVSREAGVLEFGNLKKLRRVS